MQRRRAAGRPAGVRLARPLAATAQGGRTACGGRGGGRRRREQICPSRALAPPRQVRGRPGRAPIEHPARSRLAHCGGPPVAPETRRTASSMVGGQLLERNPWHPPCGAERGRWRLGGWGCRCMRKRTQATALRVILKSTPRMAQPAAQGYCGHARTRQPLGPSSSSRRRRRRRPCRLVATVHKTHRANARPQLAPTCSSVDDEPTRTGTS